jgi:formate hydrogenlyase transcriptional activator
MSRGFPGDEFNNDERTLLEAVGALTRRLDVSESCTAVLKLAERVFAARSAWVLVHERQAGCLVTIDASGPAGEVFKGARVPLHSGVVGVTFRERRPVFVADVRREFRWFDVDRVHRSGLRSVLSVPIEDDEGVIGVLGLDSPRFTENAPPAEHEIAKLVAIAAIAAAAIRNARLLASIELDRARLRRLTDQRQTLKTEVSELRDRIRHSHSPVPLVGDCAAFRDVLKQVELVAPADSTVLLVGETGTGKEVIARAVHDGSPRRGRAFVPVNCAAMPDALVESELFGYEKGAFTGAQNRTAGKFEGAHQGTVFLDEIGELPAAAQAKLLRVLQEHEVHRVGGLKPVPVDVRVIAATNKDLASGMRDGHFRADLFYRLNVFPIRVPPLRERRPDIAVLARHFARQFSERQHKPTPHLADEVVERLINYDWPGNIRELQNVIERAIILVRGDTVTMDLIALHEAEGTRERQVVPASAGCAVSDNVIRFCDAERRALVRALEACGWRISGHGGAAELLGLKPTTMHAKMKKLGIGRPSAAREPDDALAAPPVRQSSTAER